ncbi:GAF domain-containing sensor histidine kinase [Sphingomonas hylomeconis]|uniref:GAF domain-containing sensor histidine kinase n=1 Tax=Sphingomonas hylomeconis TaxID=1395958 RepID=UPI0021BA466C|nr:GAF domain-containing sensor histidine kinase [Sphingomonas hylomeconis]
MHSDTPPRTTSDDVNLIQKIAAVPTILDTVCRITGMGFAAVARVTSDRWIACSVKDDIAFGLTPGGELAVETTICSEIRESGELVVINHVAENEAYRAHRTPALYGFQSYISVPINLPDGQFFGTLCAIDPRPAKLHNPETIGMFRMFADLIAFHLDAQARIERSEANLLDEQKTAELREQFIAVLGHDLRNPLAALDAGTRLLSRNPDPAKATAVLGMMQSSVVRMAKLIDNVLDLARGRLGGGLAMQRETVDLSDVLALVVEELQAANPLRVIEARLYLAEPVHCDRSRIAQMLSNLLGNALSHGATDAPIEVIGVAADGVFELSVTNSGAEIPPGAIARLFQPFERGAGRGDKAGLGLGLYIASEIATAHGGTLGVVSSPERTCFTFRMAI